MVSQIPRRKKVEKSYKKVDTDDGEHCSVGLSFAVSAVFRLQSAVSGNVPAVELAGGFGFKERRGKRSNSSRVFGVEKGATI
jgi:hypothetical protein